MADEPAAAVAEPETSTTLKGFGDLAEVFDKAFPATAQKKESDDPHPESPQPTEVPATTPSLTPAVTPTTTPEATPSSVPETKAETSGTKIDELPDFLTGKKPSEPVKPVEPEIPAPTGKESVGMKQLRTAYENLKKTAAEKESGYTQQIEELKKAPPTAPDAEATIQHLKHQVEELSGAVERTAIEFHPAFRAEFIDRRQQLLNDAHQILQEAKADPNQWDRAMSLTGQARTEALEEIYDNLPRAVSSELGSAAREIRSLDSRRDAFLADRKGLQERLQQDHLRQQREQLQTHEKNTLEMLSAAEKDIIDRMGIEVYKTSDNPEHKKWNESVERMKADARKLLLETTDQSVMARAALLAPAAIQYRYLYHVMRDRWLEEKAKNEAVEKAAPDAKTRGEPSSSEDDKLSFAESVARQVFGK